MYTAFIKKTFHLTIIQVKGNKHGALEIFSFQRTKIQLNSCFVLFSENILLYQSNKKYIYQIEIFFKKGKYKILAALIRSPIFYLSFVRSF